MKRILLVVALQFIAAALAVGCEIHMDTKFFIENFLQLVWGLLVIIGSNLVFIHRAKPDEMGKHSALNKDMMLLSYFSALQLIGIILLAIVYPYRIFIASHVPINSFQIAARLYDSILFFSLLSSCVITVMVGAWSVYLQTNKDYWK